MILKRNILFAAALVALATVPSFADQNVSANATQNATVRPAGVRTGANGLNFFNVQGSGNNTNASFGVLEFTPASFAITETVTDITNLQLSLFNAPAGFSLAGTVNFYLATDVTTSISNAAGASPLTFTGTGEGITNGGQLGTLYALGSGSYTNSGTAGTRFDYSLALTDAAGKNLLVNSLNNGTAFRIVATAPASLTSATYAGAGNATTTSRPTLGFTAVTTVVPETSTVALAGLGILPLALVAIRRRKTA